MLKISASLRQSLLLICIVLLAANANISASTLPSGTHPTVITSVSTALPPTRTQFDFDGDLKADIAVYRIGTISDPKSYWHILRSSDNTYQGIQLGTGGDRPVPADYNGDGLTEAAVWRPSNGTWYTSPNPAINYGAFQWGQNGDVPLPEDFDGDGKADYVVYRLSNSTWYIIKSQSGAFQAQSYGAANAKPMQGDFDGDNRADFVFYRPGSTSLAPSIWNVLQSTNNVSITVQFGRGEDIPVPADYDGDHLTNYAVFRPSSNTWYTSLEPATNYGAFVWGSSGDIPAPADYDRDGRADYAIFRSQFSTWYVYPSMTGMGGIFGQQWGIPTDRPVPSSFIPY